MVQNTVQAKVADMVVELVGVERTMVVPEARLMQDLNLDSLDAVELTLALEEEFDISVSDEEVVRLDTISDVIELIQDKLENL